MPAMRGHQYDRFKIVDLREGKGLTQAKMAKSLGITLRQYQRAEGGGVISYDLLEKIAHFHDLSTIALITGQPRKSEKIFQAVTT